jgi:hypothetical protein
MQRAWADEKWDKILVEKPGRKRQLGSPRSRWNNNISMDLRGIAMKDVDPIHLVQDRGRWLAFVNTIINPRVP